MNITMSDSNKMMLYSTSAVILSASAAFSYLYFRKSKQSSHVSSRNSGDSDNVTRTRSMSFSSQSMIGSFPKSTHVAPPVINIVLLFEQCPTQERVEEAVAFLVKYDRFRCTPVTSNQGIHFQECSDNILSIDPEDFIKNKEVSSEKELHSMIDDIIVDTSFINENMGNKPLWEIVRIENINSRDTAITTTASNGETTSTSVDDSSESVASVGGVQVHALIIRVHHVIGDGVSLISTIGKLFYDESSGCSTTAAATSAAASGGREASVSISGVNRADSQDTYKVEINFGGAAKGSKKLSLSTFFALSRSFFDILFLALSPYDTNIPFSHTYQNNNKKHLLFMNQKATKSVIFPTFQLSFIKEIKNKAGVSLNDVIFAATAGCIQKYCDMVDGGESSRRAIMFRALMPVAFPRKDLDSYEYALRNKWAFVSTQMPINGHNSVLDRLQKAHKITSSLKSSPLAGVQMWIQTHMLPYLPKFLTQKTAFDVFARHSIVFSNVPGPEQQLHMCGQKLVGLQALFPNVLPQVIIVSYGGALFYSMCVNEEEVRGAAECLPQLYYEEIIAMAQALDIPVVDPASVLADSSREKVFGLVKQY